MKEFINTMKLWAKHHTKAAIAVAVGLVAIITFSIAGMAGVFSPKTTDTASNTPKATAKVPTKTKKTPVTMNVVTDEKVTKASTPTIAHVQSTDKREKPIDFYHAIDSDKKTDMVEVSPGDYKITVTGVINDDGSVAKPTKESKEITISVKSADEKDNAKNKANVNIKLDNTIPADKVTEEDIKEIADTTRAAIENGDKSLKGDAGKAILKKVENNTKANANISEDAKATIARSTEKAQESTETEAKATVAETPKSASETSTPTPEPTPAPKPTEKKKTWVPEKGHWEDITEKVWVSNVVTITDKPAWDERVEDGVYYIFSDGYIASSVEEYKAYDKKMLLAGTPVSYTFKTKYKTVHHDAVTHTEDRGHYETKVTGRKWVVDQAGHYE